MIGLCQRESSVHGAGPCPRGAGHRGECYWWLPWEGDAGWRVIVYSGQPYSRRRRCMGSFTSEPSIYDVNFLLKTLAPLRRREVARRSPASEPTPISRPVKVTMSPDMKGMVLIRG